MQNMLIDKNSPPYRAPAVSRALSTLRLLASSPELLGVSDIARALGIGKSTVHVIPQTLLVEGAVQKVEGKKFRLGSASGMRVPLPAGAAGKVCLAWSGARVPEELPAFTAGSITDPRVMAHEVEQARGAGVAFDRGEYLRELSV